MADTASRDPNHVPSLLAVSSVDGSSTVTLYADPITHRLLVADTSGGVEGTGSSTDNAVVRWNGVTGDAVQNSLVTIDDLGNITATNVTGTNTGDQNIFSTISVSGQSDIIADTTSDTLTLVNGANIAVTTNAGTDSATISFSGTLPVANGGTGQTSLSAAGIPQIVASGDLTAQSAAVASITTATSPNDGSSHTYSVGGYITVTAISVNTITLQVTYTDETSTSRAQSFFGEGLTTAAVSTTGGFAFPPMTIRVKANTAITVLTAVVGVGSETYDTGGYITRIN